MDKQSSLQQKRTLQDAWTGKGTFATTLLLMFVDAYGTEGFTWAEQTIRMEIEDDFEVKLPQANFDRLMAAVAILTTEDFYKSLPDFIQLCNILSGSPYDPRQWDPADATEVAWGITEAVLIEPPDEDEPFTEEIRAYIGKVLDDEGIMEPPDILRLASRETAADISNRIQADFTDDPTMFTAIYEFEAAKTDDINGSLLRALTSLASQLEALPLKDGNTEEVVQRMLRTLQLEH